MEVAHNAQVIAHTEIVRHVHKATVLTEVAHKVIAPMETGLRGLKVTVPMEVALKVTVRSDRGIAHTATAHHDLKATAPTGVAHKATVRSAQATAPMVIVHLVLKATVLTGVVRSDRGIVHTVIVRHVHKATVRSAQATAPTVIVHLVLKVTAHMAVVLKATVLMATALSVRATALANAPGSKTLLSARCQRVGAGSHVVGPVKWSSTTKMPGSHSMQHLVHRPKVHHSKMCGFALMAVTNDEVAARKFKSQRSALVQTSVSCLPMSPLPSARLPNQQLLTDARSSFRT
jgi:hypothetical protein